MNSLMRNTNLNALLDFLKIVEGVNKHHLRHSIEKNVTSTTKILSTGNLVFFFLSEIPLCFIINVKALVTCKLSVGSFCLKMISHTSRVPSILVIKNTEGLIGLQQPSVR